MPLTDNQKPLGSDTNWADKIDTAAKSDQRSKPWESVVETATVDESAGDVVNVAANPQAACDISVSA
ncbi:hypothetical protein ACJ41O_000060 [Fusarium nematophilum]